MTITKAQFIDLLNNGNWSHVQNDHGIHTEISLEGGSFTDQELEFYNKKTQQMEFIIEYQGGVDITSVQGDIEITFQRGYWSENRAPGEITLYDFEQAEKWMITGSTEIVDGDGAPLFDSSESIEAFMEEHAPSAFSSVDIKKLAAA